MRARRVFDFPVEDPNCVGRTIVATWWPGRNYQVLTLRLDGNTAIERLTRCLEQGVPYIEAKPAPERFLTRVSRCDIKVLTFTEPGYDPLADPLYERKYPDVEEAKIGHTETVGLLATGRLKLR